MFETAWLYVLIGVFLGLLIRNIYYTYIKVSKEGKKFEWSYVMTAAVTAILATWGIINGSEHIVIPDYMIEKGIWALLAMGFMVGMGGNEILNIVLKNAKQIGNHAKEAEQPKEEPKEETKEEVKETKVKDG